MSENIVKESIVKVNDRPLRKGIEKMINSIRKYHPDAEAYVKWLMNTNLPLKDVKLIDYYAICCLYGGQDSSLIVKEIEKYIDEPNYWIVNLAYDWDEDYRGDILMGDEQRKSRLRQLYDEDEKLYRIIRKLYKHKLEDEAELETLILSLPDPTKIGDFMDKYDHHPAYERLRRYSSVRAEMDISDKLTQDFYENKENSLAYKLLMDGYTINTYHLLPLRIMIDKDPLSALPYIKGKIYTPKKYNSFDYNYPLYTTLHPLPMEKCKLTAVNMNKFEKLNPAMCIYEPYMVLSDVSRYGERTIRDKKRLKAVKDILPQTEFSVKLPYKTFRLEKNSGVISLSVTYYPSTKYEVNNGGANGIFRGDGVSYHEDMFFAESGAYIKLRNRSSVNNAVNQNPYGGWRASNDSDRGRWIPLTIKKLVWMEESYFGTEFKKLFLPLTESKPLFKDAFLADCVRHCPITYKDAMTYRTRKEYIMDKYGKDAVKLDVNYNAINLDLAYIMIKAIPYIREDNIRYLQNIRNLRLVLFNSDFHSRRIKDKVAEFITNYYLIEKGYASDIPDEAIAIRDYIYMCVEDKRKIALNWSKRHLLAEHDHFNDNMQYANYIRRTPVFSVKKDSKFCDLRKKLPEEFEWIKNRKRLIKESMEMHHCVWSYAGRIKSDNCAIYSYFDKEGKYCPSGEKKRYTIEFTCDKKGKYRIMQIQTAYDRFGGDLLKKELESMLEAS